MAWKGSLAKGRRTAVSLLACLVLAGGLAPAESRAEGKVETKRFTGAPGQWDGIQADAVSGDSPLQMLKAVQRQGKLHMLVKGSDVREDGVFYIQAGGDAAEGAFVKHWSDSSRVDYKIEGGRLYRYREGGWEDAGIAEAAGTASALETAVDLSLLGSGRPGPIKVAYSHMPDNSFLPDPGKPMLAADAEAEAYGPDPDVVVDGQAEDWSGLLPAAESEDGLTKLYAAENNEALSILAKGKAADFNDIFLDTDREKATGFNANWLWPESGFDFLFENGELYANRGGGWDWAALEGEGISYREGDAGDDRILEASIPLSLLGLQAAAPIRIGFNGGDRYAPKASGAAAKVTPSLPRVKVDGNDSEWTGVRAAASGTGVLNDLSAFVKNGNLHVLAHGTDLSGEKNLFINSDNDSATGYQGWQYGATGADYLVQNGIVYESAGSGWEWREHGAAESVVSSVYAPPGQSILEETVDMAGWPGRSGTVRVALGVGDDYAPAAGSAAMAAALTESGTGIIVDGRDEEWASVDNRAMSGLGTTTLRAVRDEEKLYLLAQGTDLNTQNEFFIDSDSDASTGWQSAEWPGSGIDYKLSRNSLYRYDGSGGWIPAGKAWNESYPDHNLAYVYLGMIGADASSRIGAAYVSKQSVSLPAPGSPLLDVRASVRQPRDPQAFYPRESFEVLNNPYMGWAAWSRDGDKPSGEPYVQPHSLVYAGMTWKELEPEKGRYDWAGIEDKYQFAYWASLGKKVNLRVVLDLPGDGPHRDIPDWLYDELVASEGASGAGKSYQTASIGSGFAPNYSSSVLIEEHKRLIEALGKRYDRDPRIAFIQIGSLGHWGEFHNWPEEDSGKFPNLGISDSYVQAYVDSFPHKLLGMRKPFPIAADNKLGLFNDVFGDKGSTQSWLSWTKEGWSDIGLYMDPGQDASEVKAASRMPDFWQSNYSGGEFTSGNPLLSLRDDAIMESLREARASHTSWLGPSAPADYRVGAGSVTGEVQENMDSMLKTMGYRFVLESVKHPYEAVAGRSISIASDWTNKGVAPFYLNWPVAVALADAEGRVIPATVTKAEADIRKWLPGGHQTELPLHVPEGLRPGAYTVVAGILDPDTGQPGLTLAIDGGREDGWHSLDRLEVKSPETTPTSTPTSMPTPTSSSTPTPNPTPTPTPTPTPAETPPPVLSPAPSASPPASEPEVQRVGYLPASADGIVAVQLEAGKKELRIPVALAVDAGMTLTFAAERFSLALPAGLIRQLKEWSGREGLSDADLYLKWHSADAAALASGLSARQLPEGSSYHAAGEAIALEAGLRQEGGVIIPLARLDEPAILSMKPAAGADPKLTGLYSVEAGGEPAYLGGGLSGNEWRAGLRQLGGATFVLLAADIRFTDVPQGHWALQDIRSLAAKRIVQGIGAGRFAPGSGISRAEFAVMLAKALDVQPEKTKPGFTDAASTAYYAGYAEALAKLGIIGGSRFMPRDAVTRQEAALMLQRAYEAAGSPAALRQPEGDVLDAFSDRDSAAVWARAALRFLVGNGLMNGTAAAALEPAGTVSRAQAAVLLSRWLELSQPIGKEWNRQISSLE